ncbi:glycosyltransferase family 4 protein [Nocardioides anomalus]|uniref:Glycosyltransferase family 4 protein n=1 Tax=Nocardioides anomalus TaxID=2712223 RepID=A0A6G6WDQ7_9ACTN|nr:glycosyltransferase family 4 protein [Nocardioides anomalus]QIG43364.1 glycosyltransferase family 4 protein [Nocardioides anomalus]
MGGIETHVAEVARRLVERGEFDVTVLATDRSGRLPRDEVRDGVRVLRRRSWPAEKDFYFAPGVGRVVARGPWDLVHVQGVHTLVPPLAMAAARAARTPYVLTFHSGGHSSEARRNVRSTQWRVLAPLLRRADHLIAVSRFERAHFSAATGIDQSHFTVVPNGGALPPVPQDVVRRPGRLVSSGRLERYKGHHRAIEALPLIRQRVPGADLVILGSGGYEEQLRSLADRMGVGHAVEIRSLPPTDRSAMARELGRASVMAALSTYEAHPVGIMEALTLGLPVVGFDVAGTGDLVADGLVTGIPEDAPNVVVADVLSAALEDADRGLEPRQPQALELPTWETTTDGVAEVYRRVLAQRGRP